MANINMYVGHLMLAIVKAILCWPSYGSHLLLLHAICNFALCTHKTFLFAIVMT
jgi:hypothetical protein